MSPTILEEEALEALKTPQRVLKVTFLDLKLGQKITNRQLIIILENTL